MNGRETCNGIHVPGELVLVERFRLVRVRTELRRTRGSI